MSSTLNPYVQYQDNARQAMEFYRDALGGNLTLMTFGDMGIEGPESSKVMHAQLETPAGFTLMASDTPDAMGYTPGANVAISISGDDVDALRTYFSKLSLGGEVTIPLSAQQWGAEFGMFTDQFGIRWMINIAVPSETSTDVS